GFGLATAVAVGAALHLLRRAGAGSAALVRATQAATVLPLCALTLAVGGDDLPVLALCLLSLALAVRGSWLGAGLAVGAAGALKLFAWPVALVLVAYAITKRAGIRCALPALGLPVVALIPAFAVNRGAAVENVVRLPLGRGLVESPAQSPFPGHLIAVGVPGGRAVAAARGAAGRAGGPQAGRAVGAGGGVRCAGARRGAGAERGDRRPAAPARGRRGAAARGRGAGPPGTALPGPAPRDRPRREGGPA